jgi:sarcosine/dimethylglycine N-methyltransferase
MTTGDEAAGHGAADSVAHARLHYDRELTDQFYHAVWAEDDLLIGVGLFESPDDRLQTACRRTVRMLMDRLPAAPRGRELSVLDLGGGYGASARMLVRERACRVVCVNLGGVQNREHRARNAALGLAERISVVDGDFQDLPEGLGTFDVVWSQDAFVHASDRHRLFAEMDRVAVPGGDILFTDLLRQPDCADDALAKVHARLGLSDIATLDGYCRLARDREWTVDEAVDLSGHLLAHYRCLRATLDSRRAGLLDRFRAEDLARIGQGIDTWIDAAEQGHLRWGLFHFQKPGG